MIVILLYFPPPDTQQCRSPREVRQFDAIVDPCCHGSDGSFNRLQWQRTCGRTRLSHISVVRGRDELSLNVFRKCNYSFVAEKSMSRALQLYNTIDTPLLSEFRYERLVLVRYVTQRGVLVLYSPF